MLLAGPVGATPLLPHFSTDTFVPDAPITNTYFPLLPGQRDTLVAMGVDDDGEAFFERTERSFAGEGPEILGVRTTRMLDRAYEGDFLVEETYDYHAQDILGNVWYLGEDVTNYHYDDDGNLVGTDSELAWRADGVEAFPGWVMPASTELGLSYYQEFAPEDDALDEGLTVAILDSLQAGGAVYFSVLKVLEFDRGRTGRVRHQVLCARVRPDPRGRGGRRGHAERGAGVQPRHPAAGPACAAARRPRRNGHGGRAPPKAVTGPKPPSYVTDTHSSEVLAVLTLTVQPLAAARAVTQSKAASVSPRSMEPGHARC